MTSLYHYCLSVLAVFGVPSTRVVTSPGLSTIINTRWCPSPYFQYTIYHAHATYTLPLFQSHNGPGPNV